jgi:hypothetical protein
MSEWIKTENEFKWINPVNINCDDCKKIKEYAEIKYPGRQVAAYCERCLNDYGIVPVDLKYNPYEN